MSVLGPFLLKQAKNRKAPLRAVPFCFFKGMTAALNHFQQTQDQEDHPHNGQDLPRQP
ncbi:hypothetical protein FHS90_001720 [Rufibacter quisquiliarum]|uniref:Uncharacterized protein n=1 Tax=Rufibacter quisquiliarum TaxID=1549639 RepID=A0A839GDM2_9BACT|nr:hypothetical protein [Rufibacter quisquiliarum]